MDVELSDGERRRYAAQIASGELGLRGQEALKQARVLVVGAGRIGTTVAAALASAGTGYLGVVDGGTVGEADLASQSVHFTPDVGAAKADSVAGKLGVLNPEVQADSFPVRMTGDNCEAIVAGHDLVVACVGDMATRLLVNDACMAAGIVLIDCVAGEAHGAVQVVDPGETACLRCAAAEVDGRAITPGLAGVVGALGAVESIRRLSGANAAFRGRVELDLDDGSIDIVPLGCDVRCEMCRSIAIAPEVHA